MMKFFIFAIFFIFHTHLCFSTDIGFYFPNNAPIREFVSCEVETTSVRTEKTIIPSYRIILTKEKGGIIKELAVEIIYHYGQDFHFTNRKMFILTEQEIFTLNTNGQTIISNTLFEMEREPLVILESAMGYVQPDGEYISNIFYKLVIAQVSQSKSWSYTASSYLIENNIKYSPNNLSTPNGLPWASANGYGIHDKITIDMGNSPSDSLKIINGFVSAERPDLFLANSRVKRIRLTNISNGKYVIKIIEDTQAIQNIDIQNLQPLQNTKLEVEVLSVYPGIKYRDLCIQAIF